jgi:hypothetical protein
MVVSLSEDIAPTCPCEDPTQGTVAIARVAYMALVDQHMVPSEGMVNRTLGLLPWDGLLPVRHLGRPTDVALLLSSECLPSTASLRFLPWRGPWMLLSWLVLRNGCLMCVLVQ